MSNFIRNCTKTFATAGMLSLAMTAATPALAQAKGSPFGGMAIGGGGGSSHDEYRSFVFSMPVANLNGETIAHMEMNLAGQAGLALELTAKRAFEEIDEETIAATGESRSSQAKGAALIFSRYANEMSLSGFYWAFGAGYRQEDVAWRVRPDARDPEAANAFSLINYDGNLHHDARLSGTTGHLRTGYRYVGQDMPIVAGLYLGARHFQPGVQDADVEHDDDVRVADMTDREKERLRRKYSTRPECGLEVGFRF